MYIQINRTKYLIHSHIMNNMKANYPISYMVAIYGVTVRCKDDGAHFPLFTYNGYIPLSDKKNITDEELYSVVRKDFEKNFKDHIGVTIDEFRKDEAFEGIEIDVHKEVFYSEKIKITK